MPPCLSTYSNSGSWWLKPSSFRGHQEKCSGISRWIDLRSYCSSCQLFFFSRAGWRKWKSTSHHCSSQPSMLTNAEICWPSFSRDWWDWQCRVASATGHELLGLMFPYYIMLGLGDWCLWYLTNNFTKIIQIINSHQQRACCLPDIVTYRRCNCLWRQPHLCMSGHTVMDFLHNFRKAKGMF